MAFDSHIPPGRPRSLENRAPGLFGTTTVPFGAWPPGRWPRDPEGTVGRSARDPWNVFEDDVVRGLLDGDSMESVRRELPHRSERAIRERAKVVKPWGEEDPLTPEEAGIFEEPRRPEPMPDGRWSEEEDRVLLAMAPERGTPLGAVFALYSHRGKAVTSARLQMLRRRRDQGLD